MAQTLEAPKQTSVDEATPPHRAYVPDDTTMPELTWPALVVGVVLGIIFGASSLYLVLKVGMTVSASIPVAVLSITLFRAFSRLFGVRRATILENNIVQTTGSAGESIAFGVGVTMPALMLLGFEMDVGRVMVISILGGLLGILMMIPLRRAFIVKKHGELKYPEGTACAKVLIVGEQGGASAKTVFVGFGIAFAYQFLMQGMKLWRDIAARPLRWYPGAVPAIEVNPALLGVGYIIGTRVACIMVAGGVLASFVLIPAIKLFGGLAQEPLFPATKLISAMTEEDIWGEYILYIGSGAVAAGGIISLFQAIPLIGGSILAGVRDLGARRATGSEAAVRRTDRDLPIWIVGVGAAALVVAIWGTTWLHELVLWVPQLHMNWLGAVLIVLFGFLFVTVSSRLTGEIGSSSNPISGMTVAALLLTCLIFLSLGWVSAPYRLAALSVAAVVCIAASNGGTTSQDLKTGFLVGGTPKLQQIAILVGALTSALVIGVILIVLNDASTVYSQQNLPELAQPLDVSQLTEREQAPGDDNLYYVWHAIEGNDEGVPTGKYLVDDAGAIQYLVDPGVNGKLERRDDGTPVQKFNAPKARLMALVTDGILNQKLPWTLVLLGVFIAIVLELCKIPSLPFAVGVYLPLHASTPIFVGGLTRWVADRFSSTPDGRPRSQEQSDMSSGVLLATGYIAGGAIAGVLVAFLAFSDTIPRLLANWQHRTEAIAQEMSLEDAAIMFAQRESIAGSADEESDDPNTTESELHPRIKELAAEISELNSDLQSHYAQVPAGTTLVLPGRRQFRVDAAEYLGDVAERELGSASQATLLLTLNKGTIQPAAQLPAETEFKLPQHMWPALVAFGVLAGFLLLVGLGWLMATPPMPAGPEPDNGDAPVVGDKFQVSTRH